MDYPKSRAYDFTEELMVVIREHLKEDPPPQENHHYNRVFEKVLTAAVAWFKEGTK